MERPLQQSTSWPPILPANSSWHDIVALQLKPWRRGIDINKFLRDSRRLRGLIHPPAAALVDTRSWSTTKLGARWVGHHSSRAEAVLNLFRLTQRRAIENGRPLPHITFVLVVSDGHGATAAGFNATACSCTRESNCCYPHVDAAPEVAPAAPSFATLYCRHAYDVSVPTIIDDLISDTRSKGSIAQSLRKWVSLGDSQPWDSRERTAFFVGDDKAHRPAVLRAGKLHSDLFDVHRAVSTDKMNRVPFSRHAKHKATIYAHGFHFNSVRWRRLSLLGGAVIAEEGPCKEWWQLLAKPWQHYAPTHETFSDVVDIARKLLDPSFDGQAWRMASNLKALGLRALSADGIMDYLEALWREYARLQALGLHEASGSRSVDDDKEQPLPPSASSSGMEPPLVGPDDPGMSHSAKWKCTGWPADASVGGDEARCLHGNTLQDGFEYSHNSKRGSKNARCVGACTCCRRSKQKQQRAIVTSEGDPPLTPRSTAADSSAESAADGDDDDLYAPVGTPCERWCDVRLAVCRGKTCRPRGFGRG